MSLQDMVDARQCPVRRPGHAVDSVAIIHIPKTAGTFLHVALHALLPQAGSGRWCTWGDEGTGRDLPPVFSNCGGGDPGPDHQKLFEATRMAFTHNCSGFAAHQDVAYFDAVGVDYSRTLTLTALRHPVDRVISAYFYSLRVDAPFLEGYKPQNDTDFTGLMRFVEENPIDSNNLMTQHLGGSRHCNWPGIAPAPPREQRLEAAKRNLARICVIILSEFMDESLVRLAKAGGWASRRVLKLAQDLEAGNTGSKVNATPKPKIPVEVRLAIERNNREDMRLYEYAVQLFLRRSLTADAR
ncbi:hypothetical protein CHLNCDRAFT_140052 [Chlorella variabilis]|uniref:Sulfotransferase n=1 Tax=Chlorella variabilis TaxID=554065 RepID=E1ZRH3_CHLVA|nr:hypothetical protein CHLNCDRAFT_140052 [Chlorella variabilis]EFN51567.1 hypothetical protein CHLNCDRAFT_140052 [Chlorella variabilis]|eukprot:XP_005843669.1 hypothetical protein CHLNCDRAFT_140052 [Chlorella variabilis]